MVKLLLYPLLRNITNNLLNNGFRCLIAEGKLNPLNCDPPFPKVFSQESITHAVIIFLCGPSCPLW